MDVHGYEIDIKNVSFQQEIQVVIKCQREKRPNEIFTHDIYFDNLSLKFSNEELEVSNVPHRGIDFSHWYVSDKRIDVRYDKVANCVVFMLLELKSKSCMTEPEYTPYVELQRFYVTPEKNIIYNSNQRSYYYEEKDRLEAMSNPNWVFIEEALRIGDFPFNIQDFDFLNETTAEDSYEKISKHLLDTMGMIFNKSVMVAGNKSLTLNSKFAVMEFLTYKEPKVRKGPQQQRINELCDIEVKPFVPAKIEQSNEFIQEGRLLKITDDISCFQMFRINKNREEFYETFRIFIESNGNILTCKKNNYNKFVPTKFSMDGSHWQAVIRDEEYDKEATSNNKLAYYKDIIMSIPCEARGYAIWCFLTNDIFEKLYKAGLQNYLNPMFLFAPNSPENQIQIHFNLVKGLNEKAPINQILGLNNHQVNKFMELFEKLQPSVIINGFGGRFICKLKSVMGSNDISPIDDKTFDYLFDYFLNNFSNVKQTDKFGYTRDTSFDTALNYASDYTNTYGLSSLLNYLDVIKMITEAGYFAERMYTDLLKMIRDMEAQSTYKLKVKNEEELRVLHDNITSLYNLKKNEYKLKAFQNRIPYWEKFVFSDEQYAIVAPQTPDDMVNEGNKLHHCVKSYIDRVSNGTTNVLFLRKVEELDEPFFTIELSNDNKIEQVHGLCNRNMSTEPGVSEFVSKWAKKKKLSLNNCNKVR